MFTVDGELRVPPIHACLPPNFTMHFSFDMAQQVWLEHPMHMHMYVTNRCTIPATPNSLVLVCDLWGLLRGYSQTGGT